MKKQGALSSVVKAKEEKVAKALKPARFALDGNKWAVDHQVGNRNIVIEETEAKQTVYIYQCDTSTIQIKGKINNITLDGCKKTAVVFETAIAGVEFVNCISCEVQCLNKCPSFAVDKCSGVQLYLSKESIDSEIVTSKSSEMNVVLPADEGIELAIPEQFKTKVVNGKLITESVAHV